MQLVLLSNSDNSIQEKDASFPAVKEEKKAGEEIIIKRRRGTFLHTVIFHDVKSRAIYLCW